MKLLLTSMFLLSSFSIKAESFCRKLLIDESRLIDNRDGYMRNVGGHIYVSPYTNRLDYYPGIPLPAQIENWARDLSGAINSGPYSINFSGKDERKDILEMFRKEIKEDCRLPDDNYLTLRHMLRELLDENMFCKDGALLPRPKLTPWKNYRKALSQAIESGRFQALCSGIAVVDSSTRGTKEVGSGFQAPQKSSRGVEEH